MANAPDRKEGNSPSLQGRCWAQEETPQQQRMSQQRPSPLLGKETRCLETRRLRRLHP